jgi:N-methylhydantoinase B
MLGPIEREILSQLFAAVPEEMGAVLVRSARSPNIRERRDSSAALFTAAGELIAQAAHIPVHLGAMPEAVAAVRAEGARAGELWVLNDPYTGGTHLPDITVIEAVGSDARAPRRQEGLAAGRGKAGGPIAYAVVRAHHADVGGSRPGSMAPDARRLEDEGVVIPPTRIGEGGVVDDEALDALVHAMREPAVRRADLAAQLAAARRGGERWNELIARYGAARLDEAVHDLLDYAERRARAALSALSDGVYEGEDAIEGDGLSDAPLPIRARLTVAQGTLAVDFAGTAPATAGNVNCPISVARSAALFAARCLIPADVPTNGGVARCVRVEAPLGCLVNAEPPHAVAAGNVETSQRIADLLLDLLRAAGGDLPAQGQGTMNNVILGTADWVYYETLGGGQGATRHGPGPSGVHVGMSNTRNTPVEVLEMELPLRVEEYSIRHGSGGAAGGQTPRRQDAEHRSQEDRRQDAKGSSQKVRRQDAKESQGFRGGDGVVRQIRVLQPCSLSLVTERRRTAPKGAAGGGDGLPGRNLVNEREVGSKVALDLAAGDVVRIETPGGGGYGSES